MFSLLVWGAKPTQAATDLGDVCWLTDAGKLLRFTVTQTGSAQFLYSGTLVDVDDTSYAVIGHVKAETNTLIGSFSGAKTTATHLTTGIFLMTLNRGTMAGSIEGIRHRYERSSASVATDYRTQTVTPTRCP